MGNVAGIGFEAGSSPVHRLDPRTKQLLILGLSLCSLGGSLCFLAATSLTLLCCIQAAGLRLSKLLYVIRYFLIFLLFIFFIRTVSFTSSWQPQLPAVDQVLDATIICWRLLLVTLMCLLLMATTRTSAIRAALIWLLHPIPFINERTTATMVGLLVRFLPLILLQAHETTDALRARGIESRRNPFRRLIKFSIPLFHRVFLQADDLVDTMQARCYNENRTLPRLVFSAIDGKATLAATLLMLTALFP